MKIKLDAKTILASPAEDTQDVIPACPSQERFLNVGRVPGFYSPKGNRKSANGQEGAGR